MLPAKLVLPKDVTAFPETGFKSLLEAKRFARLDNASPFLGVIMDRYCEQPNESPVTTVFI